MGGEFSPIPKGGGANDEPLTASQGCSEQWAKKECNTQRKQALLNEGVERALHKSPNHTNS